MANEIQFGTASDVTEASAAGKIIHNSHDVGGVDPFPAAAGVLTVVSTDANDAPGMGGAEAVAVRGLRFDGTTHTEDVRTVAMNGLTPVQVWLDGFRCNNLLVVAGSTNLGDINALIGGVQVNRITAAVGASESATFSLPDVQDAEFLHFRGQVLASGSDPAVIIRAFVRTFDGPWVSPNPPIAMKPSLSEQFRPVGRGPVIPRGSDVKIEITDWVGNDATVTAVFQFDTRDVKTP